MNSCHCSRKGPRRTLRTLNWESAAGGVRTSGLKDHPTGAARPHRPRRDCHRPVPRLRLDPHRSRGDRACLSRRGARPRFMASDDNIDVERRQATQRFSSRPARPSRPWPRVGQGKQRRSRAGSSGAPTAVSPAEPGAAAPSSARMPALQRLEVRIASAPPGSPRKAT
jgi:hypothetical protein